MVVAPSDFDFEAALFNLRNAIDKDFSKGKPNEYISAFQQIAGSDNDRKSASDQCLKTALQVQFNKEKPDIDGIIQVLQFGTASARKGLCSVLTPFTLLSDSLDCSKLEQCEVIFDFIEKHTPIWKSAQFYQTGKNNLLRACNDLLRRLSQSQNNVFCGRIHIFLTRIFPISEKSALNLNSNFNLENETNFDAEDSLETTNENKELYKSLWGVQDFFRSPNQIYEPEKFKSFETCVTNIISTFSNFKLEGQVEESEKAKAESAAQATGNHVYFPKFLTSSSLTELQLSDPSFRRQILTELLFLFQYLTGYVKFRPGTHVLPFANREWIKSHEKEIYVLLHETPPNGKKYADFVKHLIERENFWVKWKNEGCPKFMREKDPESSEPISKKRRTIFDDIMGDKKLGLGSPELTRLWGKSESNLEACKTPKRQFIPSIENFFEEAMMHADPDNEIEDSYKCYMDPAYGWRSLRLLAHSSPLFFSLQPASMHHLAVPKYLEHILKKLRKEAEAKGVIEAKEEVPEENSKSLDATPEDNEFEDEKDEPKEEEVKVEVAKPNLKISNEKLEELAKELGPKWKQLAQELRHITNADIKNCEDDADDDLLRAKIALVLWQDKNESEATADVMVGTLSAIGLDTIAEKVFGNEKMEE